MRSYLPITNLKAFLVTLSALCAAASILRTHGAGELQASVDCAVYSAAIQALSGVVQGAPLVLVDSTHLGWYSGSQAGLAIVGPKPVWNEGVSADSALMESLHDLNASSVPVPRCLTLPRSIEFITTGDLNGYFSHFQKDLWSSFYAAHPGSKGFVLLSRITYNADTSLALLYVGQQRQIREGEGIFILMARTPAGWAMRGKTTWWLS